MVELSGPMSNIGGPMPNMGRPMPKLGGPIPKQVGPIPKLDGPCPNRLGQFPNWVGQFPDWVDQCSYWVDQYSPFITCLRRPCTCEWLKNAKTADSMLLAAVNFFFFDQIISSPTILLALGNTQCVQHHFEVVC